MTSILNLIKLIKSEDLGECFENESLKHYTSLEIGGTCSLMYYPKDIASLAKVYKNLIENNIKYYVIGNGTNLLINERHFNEVFINLKKINKFHKMSNGLFYVSSGVNVIKLAKELSKEGYTGIEFLSVIPGTMGGIIYMNAGAYGKDVASIIEYVSYLSEDGSLRLIPKKDIEFKYRNSIFQKKKGIILGCIISLSKSKFLTSPISKVNNYLKNKKDAHPIGQKNAGSTFKNNENISAWQIIDKIGYRGKILGGAMVSKKHANFIVNYDNATFNDVKTLIDEIKEKSKKELNIDLECEWRILE